uniref:F-box associated beta-propeller type 1 domain-containing protein n=1 Tax=Arabidopsis lyrata subsp. lyrata TaxID=81972 RepID=B2BXI6_ARALL|nr:unknown [Arabidopsis lyrata subsp. lyrata]
MDVGWELYKRRFRVVLVVDTSFWLAASSKSYEIFVQTLNFETESFDPLAVPLLGVEEGTVALSSSRGEDLLLPNQRCKDMNSVIWINKKVKNILVGIWEKLYSTTVARHHRWYFPSFCLQQESS